MFPNFRLYFTEFCVIFLRFNGSSNRKEDFQMPVLKSEGKTQSAFTCSKLTTETLEQSVKYVQS